MTNLSTTLSTTLRTKFDFCLPFPPRNVFFYRCSLLLAMNIVLIILTSIVNVNIMIGMSKNTWVLSMRISPGTPPLRVALALRPPPRMSPSASSALLAQGCHYHLHHCHDHLLNHHHHFQFLRLNKWVNWEFRLLKCWFLEGCQPFFKSWPLDICSLFKKLVPWQLFTF